ncbi:twin transmembrane helix small protein [Parvibaculum sp.]|uniref:twin transmembrane helix small protein n=1 Tax=Parvibaculum sp. TaxID=2024848 RepID=UPI002B9EDED6|nr:twin transmembrane helix small protein [Parvibaculum sp.]HUD51598.1 twin transmembrane helix small protein [Parvibaculum sp.]
MEELFKYLGPIAMAAVVLVLGLGLFNMMRGGPGSRSQTLMRWRVGLQFVAIILLMTALYFSTR